MHSAKTPSKTPCCIVPRVRYGPLENTYRLLPAVQILLLFMTATIVNDLHEVNHQRMSNHAMIPRR